MLVVVNATEVTLADSANVLDAVQQYLPGDERLATGAGLAAAVNGTVVSFPQWPTTALTDGDRIDLLTAFVGG